MFHYTDDDGIPLWVDDQDPGVLNFSVIRSFDDDVADRDSHAVLPFSEVVALRDRLTRWIEVNQ